LGCIKPGGVFLFDMNTIYGLAVGWQRKQCYIQQNASEVFEVHRTSYDYERQIASVQITAFIQQGDLWERIDELHQERGYPLDEIRACLLAAGFEVLAVLGSLREMSPLNLTPAGCGSRPAARLGSLRSGEQLAARCGRTFQQ
jgi:hypothetical protein